MRSERLKNSRKDSGTFYGTPCRQFGTFAAICSVFLRGGSQRRLAKSLCLKRVVDRSAEIWRARKKLKELRYPPQVRKLVSSFLWVAWVTLALFAVGIVIIGAASAATRNSAALSAAARPATSSEPIRAVNAANPVPDAPSLQVWPLARTTMGRVVVLLW